MCDKYTEVEEQYLNQGGIFGSKNPTLTELKTELNLLNEIIESNLPIRGKHIQDLIRKSNASMNELLNHKNGKKLNELSVHLISSLRMHCLALILLASGTFKPEIKSAHTIELSHQASHLITHVMHHIHMFANMIPGVATAASIINFVVKCFEIKDEHELQYIAERSTESLNKYSGEELELLYKYTVVRMLLKFGNLIEDDINRFHNIILMDLIKSLEKCEKEHENIIDFADEWFELSQDLEFPELKKINAVELCQLAKKGNLHEIMNCEFSSQEVNLLVKDASVGDPESSMGHYNALHIAAAYRHYEVVKYFIEKKGGDPQLKAGRNKNFTALDCAKQTWWTWTFWQNKNPCIETYLKKYMTSTIPLQTQTSDIISSI